MSTHTSQFLCTSNGFKYLESWRGALNPFGRQRHIYAQFKDQNEYFIRLIPGWLTAELATRKAFLSAQSLA